MKSQSLNFRDVPFSRLIREARELSELRREYAERSDRERRLAADFQYHAACAGRLFDAAIGRDTAEEEPWPGEMLALAIDPTYAPALLTVGSYEYIFGRKDEAMKYFLALTKLPEETEDLVEIIEKAAAFLVKNEEIEDAIRLYLSAISEHPDTPALHNGISYCYGKLGDSSNAIEEARVAVDLDPCNHLYLTDLGWTLVEAGQYGEAEIVLKKAVDLSPPGYDLARNNLEQLRRLRIG